MKKTLTAITTIALLLLSTSAMAKGAKVPKNLCFEEEGGFYYYNLVLKSLGSMKTPDGKVKAYTVAGHHAGSYDWPVSGSAYVAPGAPTTLHATFGGLYGSAQYDVSFYELFYDLETQSGTLYFRYDFDSGTISTGTSTVNVIDCEDPAMSIPESTNRMNGAAAQDLE